MPANTFTVDVAPLERFAHGLLAAGPLFDTELLVTTQPLATDVADLAGEYAPEASKRLKDTIASDVHPAGAGVVEAVISAGGDDAPYALVVEKGRGANKPMPPPGSLDEWLQIVGIDPRADFPIRRKIGIEGIPPHPFLTRAFDELRPRFKPAIAGVPRRVLLRLVAASRSGGSR